MSERTKREVLQYFAFVGCFLAGLMATDLFMGDGPARLGSTSSNSVSVTGSATSTSVHRPSEKNPSARRMSWQGEVHEPLPTRVDDDSVAAARRLEQQRIATIQKVLPAVVAIFGLEREGGGSGVLIHPSGLALTNHHVVSATGAEGWGGLADGKLYRWKLVGNDPGGDLALIRLIHDQPEADFPFVRLGDSDQVQIGDWTMVMGNPFTLAEDYKPTVTYGIVSGVKRYQPGMGDTLLVYGNCIQVDTSINPGNSGGPLFDMQGNLIGINGRASFEFRERGRVNVGLGYAISVNQCRNFLPDLMSTKLIQHGTLDALFGDREGRVLCTAIYDDADVGSLGLELGDELIEFEHQAITTANQFTNLICTLPAGWPAQLKIRKSDGSTSEIRMRLIGLPYPKMDAPPPKIKPQQPEGSKKEETPPPPTDGPETLQQQIESSRAALFKFMSAPPGVPQLSDVNREYASWLWQRYLSRTDAENREPAGSRGQSWLIRERWTTPDGATAEWKIEVNPTQRRIVAEPTLVTVNDAPAGLPMMDWAAVDPTGLAGRPIRYADGQWSVQQPAADGDAIWQDLTVNEVKRSPVALQLWFLRQALEWAKGNSSPISLDGADRLDVGVTSRLSWEADGRTHYMWLTLDDWTKSPETQLVKLSNDPNGRESAGAVRFREWMSTLPIPWASQRQLVKGLFEDVTASVKTISIERIDNP
ncbi:MAG: trypsin-like peptidase domain-containing protein [Pirellulaceae bacterium]|nr:trypsin-like peptidase domain-containing protein [Pirellulaceae bacterium]